MAPMTEPRRHFDRSAEMSPTRKTTESSRFASMRKPDVPYV